MSQFQILYLFDPYCGWCYGFSPSILAFHEQYQNQYEFVVIPAGMYSNERVTTSTQLRSHVLNSYKQVEQLSGVHFGENYLKLLDKNVRFDSEIPSRALHTYRSFNFGNAVVFAHALQNQHFNLGRDYNDLSLYEGLADEFQIPAREFMDRFHNKDIISQVQEEFRWVHESGVQGYPSIVLRNGNKYYMISHGYATTSELEKGVAKAKKMVS